MRGDTDLEKIKVRVRKEKIGHEDSQTDGDRADSGIKSGT